MKTWVIIPARGGSKTIPRKNMQPLGGKPLIAHVLDNLREFSPIVATDDAEIEAYAFANAAEQPTLYGPYTSRVLRRKPVSDEQTLDEFDAEVRDWLLKFGASPDDVLVMVQPTSPFIEARHVHSAVSMIRDGAGSVVSCRRDGKLRWRITGDRTARPLFDRRVNRQIENGEFAETGGIFASRLESARFEPNTMVLELEGPAAIDIDTVDDWAMAERAMRMSRIAIVATCGQEQGLGHITRAKALAQCFERAGQRCLVGESYAKGYGGFLARNSDDLFLSDIVIYDVLNAPAKAVQELQLRGGPDDPGVFVVCFEDTGPGARAANLVINDLYTDTIPGALHGVQWSIVNPCFERVAPAPLRERATTVLLTFGGTDPSQLTGKALSAVARMPWVERILVVMGPGFGAAMIDDLMVEAYGTDEPGRERIELHSDITNMAALALEADIAITSAGRTVTEMMTLGIPTIVLCQNERETTHTHATADNGVINLGLGRDVAPSAIVGAVEALRSLPPRQHARELMLKAVKGRSNQRVAEAILNAYETWKMERGR